MQTLHYVEESHSLNQEVLGEEQGHLREQYQLDYACPKNVAIGNRKKLIKSHGKVNMICHN